MTNGEKMAVDRQTRRFEETKSCDVTALRNLTKRQGSTFLKAINDVYCRNAAQSVINRAIADGLVRIESKVETTTDENGVSHDTYVCRAWIEVVVPEGKELI